MGKGLLEGSWKVRGNRRGGDNTSYIEDGARPELEPIQILVYPPRKFRVGTNTL